MNRVKKFWHALGPGLTTGAADDDPAGVATYSQAGARFGFDLLWLAPLLFPLMSVVQEMCARIGLITGRGLAANIREHYPRWVLLTSSGLLFAANSLNIGADLGAMAKASQLVFPNLNFGFLVFFFTGLSLALQMLTPYKTYAKYLKWLTLVLLSYILTAFLIELDWRQVASHAIVPRLTFSREQLFLVTAVLGTTISPYLFFWQTSQEVEEEISRGNTTLAQRQGADAKEIRKMRIDVWAGMFFSNLVMFFIIAAVAGTLNVNGITNIETAADAAAALRPLAGEGTFILFALGIIGTGLLAVPVLAGSASYAVSESFKFREGLYRKPRDARAFYGIIVVSMLIGFAINFIGIDSIRALLYSAVFNALVSPVILLLIVLISGSAKIMGEWVSGPRTKCFGWLTTLLMTSAAVATIISLVI